MTELCCTVVLEQLKPNGETERRSQFRNCTVRLCRNEFRDIILQIEASNKIQKYYIHDIKLFSRFANEGRSTIRISKTNTQLYLSNCPPDKLKAFLQTISTKLECMTIKGAKVSCKQRLLSSKSSMLQDISPLSVKDVSVVHEAKLRRIENLASPSSKKQIRKRALDDNGKENEPSQKKSFLDKLNTAKATTVLSLPTSLSREQQQVLQAVLRGKSIFFTGGAGTGKSFLLKRIIGALPPNSTFATASTGVAACHIGGTTLHSFAGIGSGKSTLDKCLELASRQQVTQTWKKCRVLIIDEISMVSADYLDKLEAVARYVRKSEKPFGGIQLVLCGDFLQLPPVTTGKDKKPFAFQAKAWQTCIDTNMELTEVKRQQDQAFVEVLNSVRVGRCTQKVVDVLTATATNVIEKSGIEATRLCTHKEHVEQINVFNLKKISASAPRVFLSSDSDSTHTSQLDYLCPVGQRLELKVGAQVMLCKNSDVSKGLVNGARGIVERFESNEQALPVVRFACGQTLTVQPERWVFNRGGVYQSRRQVPLQLAWAISIHKSQGMSLDCVEMSLSTVFESGQTYVALSRCRTLSGLRVIDFDRNCIRANLEVLQFYKDLKVHSSQT